jgi:hypothetical protein
MEAGRFKNTFSNGNRMAILCGFYVFPCTLEGRLAGKRRKENIVRSDVKKAQPISLLPRQASRAYLMVGGGGGDRFLARWSSHETISARANTIKTYSGTTIHVVDIESCLY